MAEFAVVAPLLFTLVFGIIELSYWCFQTLTVSHAARLAARRGAVRKDDASVKGMVQGLCAGFGIDDDDIAIQVRNEAGTLQTGSSPRTPGHRITVTVTHTFNSLTPVSRLVSSAVVIRPSANFLIE